MIDDVVHLLTLAPGALAGVFANLRQENSPKLTDDLQKI
jgi:hypothetical protein